LAASFHSRNAAVHIGCIPLEIAGRDLKGKGIGPALVLEINVILSVHHELLNGHMLAQQRHPIIDMTIYPAAIQMALNAHTFDIRRSPDPRLSSGIRSSLGKVRLRSFSLTGGLRRSFLSSSGFVGAPGSLRVSGLFRHHLLKLKLSSRLIRVFLLVM